jgi:hypothetical protein
LRLRQIHFGAVENLPWRTFALTGVKYVWVVDRNVFTDDPARFAPERIITNPLPVVPRAFFPTNVIARPDAADCQAWMLALPEAPRLDVEDVTIVRASSAPTAGGSGDALNLSAGPDTITLEVAPGPADRFVVLNSRWHPGWSAEADGQVLSVYEANGFMMGVRIPARAASVQLKFHPVAWAFSRMPSQP